MANIGEAQITKLNREKLARLKKFIPVRDEFSAGLREDQLLKTGMEEARTRLFKPVTSMGEKIGVDISKKIGEIGSEVKSEVGKISTQLAAMRPGAMAQPVPVENGDGDMLGVVGRVMDDQEKEDRVYKPNLIFTDEFRERIHRDGDRDEDLARLVNESWRKRKPWDLNDKYKDINLKKKEYVKKVYLLREGRGDVGHLPAGDTKFNKFYKLVQGKVTLPPSYSAATMDPFPEEIKGPMIEANLGMPIMVQPKKSGEGLGNASVGHASVSCGNNILDDVLRLEVLIGGRRAGNNAPGIVNEASDILKRLLREGVIDRAVYRSFMYEIIDDYYSD